MSGLIQRLWDRRGWRLLELRAAERAHLHGLQLLVENLSPIQRDQLKLFNYFDVVGGDTGTHYRIHFDDRMNVEQFDPGGKAIRRLCFLPRGRLPVGDVMLAQKIALELFEIEALRKANQLLAWETYCPPFNFRY